jgi:hypothetical protein
MMKVVAEADGKKRKRMMPGSASSGSCSGAPPKYRMAYTPPRVSCVDHNSSRIGALTDNSSSSSSTMPYSTTAASCHQANISVSYQQLSMLQLWEDGSLCSGMSLAQAKQLTTSLSTCGQSVEGPSKGSYTTSGPHQL